MNDIPIYGFNQLYRAGTFKADVDTMKSVVDGFKAFSGKQGLQYDLLSLAIQPVPQSLIEASRAAGGNSQQSPDGPYIFTNALVQTHKGLLSNLNYQTLIQKFEDQIYPTPYLAGAPIFLNDAQFNQPIIQSYGAYERVKSIKNKYDSEGFFTNYSTGPNYS